NSGGTLGAFLKFAGYDAVFFNGISSKPVYLFINNGKAEIKDASHIWGKDTYQTEDILKAELGNDVHVACIGPAGEKLSLIASIVHTKGSVAARSGLGAVMGSKKFKAIAVKGNMKVPVADETKLRELRKKVQAELTGHTPWLKEVGTPFLVLVGCQTGDSPVKNWSGVAARDFPECASIGDKAMLEHKLKTTGCYGCVIACEALMKEGMGEYKYEAGSYRPEYETITLFGTNCLNHNIESIIKLNDMCNRYGIDTMGTGGTIAFAIDCFENGLISKKDTDGIELTWGNHKSIVAMTEKMCRREGFGAVLADGSRKAAERIGKGTEKYAIHIQGQEVPAHDLKQGPNLTATYKLDAAPATHFKGSEELHPDGFIPKFNRQSYKGRGEVHRLGNNMIQAISSAGMCIFVYMAYPSVDPVAQFMQAATGWDITTEELLKTGERITNMRLAFTLREGLNPLNFKIPDRVLGRPPIAEGPLAGITVDEQALVDDYLIAMGWDTKTVKPSKKKLLELGLDNVAAELWP
ncbi:MAG TPA: aldehyde ferredoxin oxidoreductase C-terminal domain-containing protein, partial [Dehalococcoidia bacterium]|nr:aldehyde ferredoxin oxidoreductase C-terminal domain-containing protein [Dehalococcoidia bacterium]